MSVDRHPGDPDPAAVADLVRTMALVDENIGLRAELAELRHRVEVAGMVDLAPDRADPDTELAAALARAEAAELHLAAVLASRSWRLSRAVAARLRRRHPPAAPTA